MNTEKVIEHICKAFGISHIEFNRKSRRRYIVDARFAAMKIFRSEFKYVLSRVGEIIRPDNPMDHTTVIHGNEQANFLIKHDDNFRIKYNVALSNIKKDWEIESTLPEDVRTDFSNAVESIQAKVKFTSLRYINHTEFKTV